MDYPFKNMESGDYVRLSFPSRKTAIMARTAAHVIGCRLRRKFVTKLTFLDKVVDIEVWRIK